MAAGATSLFRWELGELCPRSTADRTVEPLRPAASMAGQQAKQHGAQPAANVGLGHPQDARGAIIAAGREVTMSEPTQSCHDAGAEGDGRPPGAGRATYEAPQVETSRERLLALLTSCGGTGEGDPPGG